MVTLSRQPTKLDYASPTQFKFSINQLPKVEFFTVSANIPDLTLADVVIPTPFKPIPVLGQNLTYGNLNITLSSATTTSSIETVRFFFKLLSNP